MVPVFRQSRSENPEDVRKNTNLDLFREREDELEAELAIGNIDQAQFDAILLEMQKNLLADIDQSELKRGAEKRAQKSSDSSWNRVIPLATLVLIPALSYALYERWGYIDDVQVMGLFERTVNNVDDVDEARDLIVALGNIVRDADDGSGPNNLDDGNAWVWFFLGRNFTSMGMIQEAEGAFYQASRRLEEPGEKAMVLGNYAFTMYANRNRQITPEVQAVIEEALALNPNELGVIELMSIDAEIRQDYEAAISYWRILIQANPGSPRAAELRRSIARAQQMLNPADRDDVAGPSVDVMLTLVEGVELDPNMRVFIAARNAEREGMPPVAAIDIRIGDLPTTIRLDNSTQVGPFNLESADTIYVSALASFAGIAQPQSGDYRAQSDNFAHNGQHAEITLQLSERVP